MFKGSNSVLWNLFYENKVVINLFLIQYAGYWKCLILYTYWLNRCRRVKSKWVKQYKINMNIDFLTFLNHSIFSNISLGFNTFMKTYQVFCNSVTSEHFQMDSSHYWISLLTVAWMKNGNMFVAGIEHTRKIDYALTNVRKHLPCELLLEALPLCSKWKM